MRGAVHSPEPPGVMAGRDRLRLLKAYLGMSAATLFWASNAVAVKLALQEIPQLATTALRITLAAATLFTLYTAQGGRIRLQSGEARTFLRLGLWGLALSFSSFTLGLNHTSVSHAVFVGALVPLAVLLLAWREGQEHIALLQVCGLALSLLGVLFLALDKPAASGPSWQGDLLVAGGVACFAYYTVHGKKLVEKYSSLQFNTYSFLAAALWLSPLLLFELTRLPWNQITWRGGCSLLYSATVGSAGAYLAQYYSLRWVKASRAAVFHYLQPPLATALGLLFFSETLTTRFLLGAALILAGVFVAERR